MGKIFRLHDNGTGNVAHWQDSTPYGKNVIDAITDPNGGTIRHEITSIPSPFARIALTKTAFAEVVKSGDLDKQDTIYHKIVSDTLDVAEIFFNYEKLKDKVDILRWNIKSSLGSMESSGGSHKIVADTLDTYIKEDGKVYNLNKADSFYILRYKGGNQKTPCDVIGATSPATLFFSSANDLSYLSQDICFGGNNNPFDSNLQPLYKRDFELIKYLWSLIKSYSNFSTDFKEVYDYQETTYQRLTQEQKQDLDNIDSSLYQPLVVDVNNVEIVKGLKYALRPKLAFKSDFEIDSKLFNGSEVPLVLPIKNGNTYEELKYTSSNWSGTNKAPALDIRNLDARTLPNEGSQYPYLTISDFLEGTLVELGYKVDSAKFFDGNFISISNGKRGFLLPLKSTFFEYFTVEELMGKMSDGKNMIELKDSTGKTVTVTLRIPIKGKGATKYIEYQRLYTADSSVDLDNNHGNIQVDDTLEVALYPSLKFADVGEAYYRFGMVEESDKNYSAKFYDGAKELNGVKIVERFDKNQNYNKLKMCVIERMNFDYAILEIGGQYRGIVIPRFTPCSSGNTLSFAVDFGTTNTHIEYKVGNGPAKAFDIDANDEQISYLGGENLTNEARVLLDAEMIPSRIGLGNMCSFPTRTVLSASKTTNWSQAVFPIAHTSFDLTYCKAQARNYNELFTNLKWDPTPGADLKVKNYLETLMIMIRNKVLSNNGSLQNTKIAWTYPISMTVAHRNRFKTIWDDAFAKYISGSTANLTEVPESCTPYYHYVEANGAVNRIVTVDIGGGTSDILVAENKQIKAISSVRYAGNSLFGSGYNSVNGAPNALIGKYKDKIEEMLQANGLDGLCIVLKELIGKNDSAEINNFFFSLKDNAEVRRLQVDGNLDYNKMLQSDEHYPLVVLLFYSALIFHIAKITKAKGLQIPSHIAFSGNGSKVLRIITTDLAVLSEYTKRIFSKVYGCETPEKVEILLEVSPKELTCKGCLADLSTASAKVDGLKVVYNARGEFFDGNFKYKDIDESVYEGVEAEIRVFFEMFFELNEEYSFKNYFGIANDGDIQKVRDYNCANMRTFIKRGVENKNVSPTDSVEETLFFNYFNGALFELTTLLV